LRSDAPPRLDNTGLPAGRVDQGPLDELVDAFADGTLRVLCVVDSANSTSPPPSRSNRGDTCERQHAPPRVRFYLLWWSCPASVDTVVRPRVLLLGRVLLVVGRIGVVEGGVAALAVHRSRLGWAPDRQG